MTETKSSNDLSFWDHLEELRGCLIYSVLVLLVSFIVLFFFKGFIFDTVVLGPSRSDFWLYRLLGLDMNVKLINIEITAQFFIHIKVTFFAALVVTFPYLIYELWHFVAPALYDSERSAIRRAFGMGAGLFYLGVAFGYFVVMPVMLFFFEGYQVSESVENTFSLTSFIGIFSSMVMLMGILFEFPTLIVVLSKFGVVNRDLLRRSRKYAVMAVLALSAIVTPSGDPFTMLIVAAPLYVLYEFSIFLCKNEDPEGSED